MSRMQNTALTLTVLASLAFAAHPATASPSIGIHFQGNNSSIVQGNAGAIFQTTSWNNLTGNMGNSDSLFDTNHAATGTTVTYSASSVYSSKSSNSDPNTALMSGYLDTDNTNPTTATVSGIGYSTYDVFVYSLGDTSGRGATYNIGDTTYYLNSDDPTFSDGFHQVTNTFGTTNPDGTYTNATGNYTEFTGLTGSSFTLTATPTYANGQASRAPINGIQIVETSAPVPEASTMISLSLLLLGLGALMIRARKRALGAV